MKNFSGDTSLGDDRLPPLPAVALLFACILFLGLAYSPYHYWDEYYYLYSVGNFSLPDLLRLEPGLGRGLFPQAFFSTKIGFVAFLNLLCSLTGKGYGALLVIQFCFALVVLVFAWSAKLLLGEVLGRKEAGYTFLVLLFLPVTMYFGFKVLSELFGLIFTVFGCVAYLRLLRSSNGKTQTGYAVLAQVLLLAGVLCRFTSVVFFGGLVLGLLVLGDRRYPPFRNILMAAVLSISLIALTVLFYATVLGLTPGELTAFVGAVTVRTPGLAVKVYAVGMTVQFFVLPLVFVCPKLLHPRVRFALVWALICSLPFVLVSRYVEPRYFYMALVPLAILVHHGLLRMSTTAAGGRRPVRRWLILLVIIVLADRLLLSSLMPYELDQKRYAALQSELSKRFPAATVLVPWVSDYSFLRFAYPQKDFRLAWDPPGLDSYDFFKSASLLEWAGGGNRYLGTGNSLPAAAGPLLYVGWRYNQPAVRLKEVLKWLPGSYVKNIEKKENLKNHLALSRLWSDPEYKFEEVARIEPYEAYLVTRAPASDMGHMGYE